MSLGDLLRNAREAKGLSKKDVAQDLGYRSSQFVHNWEKGESIPPLRQLKRLGFIYSVDSEILLGHILALEIEVLKRRLRRKFEEGRECA